MSGKVSRRWRWVIHPLPVTLLILSLLLLSVYWDAITPWTSGGSGGEPTTTVIQIDSVMRGSHEIQVQLITPKANPTIVAVYVTAANGTVYGGALTILVLFSPESRGTIVSIDLWKAEGGAGKLLEWGDIVKVICADGGAASMSVT